MTTKAFYFFCETCGADTASYEMLHVCPYCHSGKGQLKLIGETIGKSGQEALANQIAQARLRWQSSVKRFGGKRGHVKRASI